MGDRLEGPWLLVGGAAIALWLEPRRMTEDIDLVPMKSSGRARLALMELAEELGLPIEAVNTAADFFVQRIPDWERDVEVLHRGARSTIYRPNATLMVLLKMRRLSERDLADCALALQSDDGADTARLLDALAALPPTEDRALQGRRERLRRLLATS